MSNFYKIYIGDYTVKEGLPDNYLIHGLIPRKHIKSKINELKKSLKKGLDIFILTPKGEIKAYYRDELYKVLDK